MNPATTHHLFRLAIFTAALALCAGAFYRPQAAAAAARPQACALAPLLSAARLPGIAAAPQVRLLVLGRPFTAGTLRWLQKFPKTLPLTVEIDGVPVKASYLGHGGFSAAYRFRYEGRDYVVKLPIKFDEAVSSVNHSVRAFNQGQALLDWMEKNRYLEQKTAFGSPEYSWTPGGREAVLADDPVFYAQLARVLAAGTYEVQMAGRKAITRTQAQQTCRTWFQRELGRSLVARREAEGFAKAYPESRLLACVALPRNVSGRQFAPDAVVEPFLPEARRVRDSQPGLPQTTGDVRAMVRELERVHRLGLIHGDIKPEHIHLDETGRARFTDWGCSHTPQQLRDGQIIFMTRELAGPARLRCAWPRLEGFDPRFLGTQEVEIVTGNPNDYNPFFDDYYGLSVSLVWAWTGTAPAGLFAPDARLNTRNAAYKALIRRIPNLPSAIWAWEERGATQVLAFTLAVLEAAGIRTWELPGYLAWGNPAHHYRSVNEIEHWAAYKILGTAA